MSKYFIYVNYSIMIREDSVMRKMKNIQCYSPKKAFSAQDNICKTL